MLVICLLTAQTRQCNGDCEGCGWSKKEADRRKELFDKRGLTYCEDGLRKLIIKSKGKRGATNEK